MKWIGVMNYVHLVIPSGSDFGHMILAVGIILFSSLGVSKRTTTDGVNDNEKNEYHNIENRELMPVFSCSLKHTCFARVALEAQHVGCPVPSVAIGVLTVLAAWRRRLAAARLHAQNLLENRARFLIISLLQIQKKIREYLNWSDVPLQVIKRSPRRKVIASIRPQNTASNSDPIPRIIHSLP